MEKEVIPTAKEYLLKTIFPTSFVNRPDEVELWFQTTPDYQESVEIMIAFTKIHVERALKEASENAEICNKAKFSGDYNPVVDEDSILNSYPLENIK